MKVTAKHRRRLTNYLKAFYRQFPNEKFTVFHFVKGLRDRTKDKKDAWIPVSGDTGTGKSYAVIMMQILYGCKYSLTDNVTYIPLGDEIMKKFKPLRRSTLLIDEAAKEMRAVNWHSKGQQGVNVAAMTDRFFENIVFLNMPDFREFGRTMKRSNAKFRIVVPYRTAQFARIIVQRKSRNWRSEDPWGDEEANAKYKLLEKRKIKIDNNMVLQVERSLTTTVMDFIIPNLATILPEVTDEYERLKMESRKIAEEHDAIVATPDRYKHRYETLLARASQALWLNKLHLGTLKPKKLDIAKILNISPSTLNKYLLVDYEKEEKKKT